MRGLGFDLDRFPCVGFRRWVWLSGILFSRKTHPRAFLMSAIPHFHMAAQNFWSNSGIRTASSPYPYPPPKPTNRWRLSPASSHTASAHNHSCLWWGLENVHILQIDWDLHISYTLLLSQKGNGAWNVSLFLGFVWHRLNNAQRHFWIISCGSRNLVRNRPLLVQMLRSSQLTIHCE